MPHIRAPKDFWSGVMSVAIAAAFLIQAQGYSLGRAGQMGPAYFPVILAFALGLVGLVLIVRSFALAGEGVPRLHLMPLAILVVAIGLFGLLVTSAGLVVASIVVVILGARAGRDFRIVEASVAAVVLAAFSIAVFVYGLGLPLKVWPQL